MAKYAFRWIYDFERLEAWLNKLAAQGWMMQSCFAGFFRFAKGVPGEYIYRVELLPYFAWSAKNHAYLQFAGEAGVERVCLWVRWAVFRKKACEGGFDIYTDTALRMAHYRRVSRFLAFFCAVEWCLALLMGGALIHGWVSGDFNADHPGAYGVIVFLFAFVIGLLIFNAARRARKRYERLMREEPFVE